MTPGEIKAARRALDLTVRDFAFALRLSDPEGNGARTVRRWETGDLVPSGPVTVAVEAMLAGFRWWQCTPSN